MARARHRFYNPPGVRNKRGHVVYRQQNRIAEPDPATAQPRRPHRAGGPSARHLPDAIRFLTRIPVPAHLCTNVRLAETAWAFPLVGVLVGAAGSAVLLTGTAIGLPAPVAATATIAAAALMTGALHEDGLADTFDGFGGATREKRLAIMRASDIGTFGITALVLVLAMRIAAVAILASRDVVTASFALMAAETVSRAVMVAIWRVLPPAREDGLAAEGGRPPTAALGYCAIMGFLALVFAMALGVPFTGALFATVFAAIGVYILATAVARSIGGRTGDTLGAVQQLTLALLLAGFSVA